MPVIGREKQEDPSVRPAWFTQWVPGCPLLCSERLCLKKSPGLMEITNCVSLKYSVPIGAPLAKRTSLSQYAFLCSPTCSWFLSFVDGTSCIDHSVSPRTGSPLCVLYHLMDTHEMAALMPLDTAHSRMLLLFIVIIIIKQLSLCLLTRYSLLCFLSKHQRQLSLPLTQSKSSPKRGFFREETDHLIKNLLGKRISKLINPSDEFQDNSREFYDNWHSKPTDYHGLLLPHIEGPEIKVWAQRYLRWIPEAQILGGGRMATMSKLLEMMEEVQSLQEKIDAKPHRQEAVHTQAPCLLRNSARLSSLFPFALLQRHSSKPVLPTSGWKALGGEDDLAKREDEFVDLGDV